MSIHTINPVCARDTTHITVTGQVFDGNSNETLPFANVYLASDSSIGTAADMDGKFRLNVPKGSKIVVSFVGYYPFKYMVDENFSEVFLTPDDQLAPVVIHGENKKKSNNWLWWLLLGGAALKMATSSDKKKKPALGQPMNVKI